jgi:hypothetical protein
VISGAVAPATTAWLRFQERGYITEFVPDRRSVDPPKRAADVQLPFSL